MSLTRAAVELVLIKRCGGLLAEVGFDNLTIDGSNTDLNDPIGWALRQAGYTVANISAVVDADLTNVTTADTDQVLDLAELRTLQNISGNWAAVDLRVGPRDEKFSQFAAALEERIARKIKQVQADYGFGAPALESGLLSFDFAAKGNDTMSEA
jgi:hypothetical protein